MAVARMIQRKLVELGRIRIGDRVPSASGKSTRPHKLLQFRLTSPNRSLLTLAAASYGGEVHPWEGEGAPYDEHDRPTQHELYTATNAIDVLIPTMSALSLSYELWSTSGCQRRCTGEVITHCPLNARLIDTPCCCPDDDHARQDLAVKGKACARILRLNVLLQDLPGMGTWRLETKGYYATAELLGTLDMLRLAGQEHQIIEAILRLEQRSVKRPGTGPGTGTLTFAVPVLWPKWSPRQLLASAAQQGHLLMSPPPHLEPARTLDGTISELYGDPCDPTAPTSSPPDDGPPEASPSPEVSQLCAQIDAVLAAKGLSSQQRLQWRGRLCRRHRVPHFADIAPGALQGMLTMLEARAAALDPAPEPDDDPPTPAPVPEEPEEDGQPEEEEHPELEPVAAEAPARLPDADVPPLQDFAQDMDIREALVELAPHVLNRWLAEDALALVENADATREQLQAALATLQSAIDNPEREGAPDDDPNP